jgi:hypothetical protein
VDHRVVGANRAEHHTAAFTEVTVHTLQAFEAIPLVDRLTAPVAEDILHPSSRDYLRNLSIFPSTCFSTPPLHSLSVLPAVSPNLSLRGRERSRALPKLKV